MANLIPGSDTVTPLYQTRDFLLKTIRMESATEPQTLALVNQAITDVRLGFISTLGLARTMEIAGYATEENPTTENGVLKARARVTECYWVIYKLVVLLPALFMENVHNVNETYNDEPLTRDSAAVSAYRDQLLKMINSNLTGLLVPAEQGTGEASSVLIENQDDDGDADPYIVMENFIGLYPGSL